MILTRTLIFVSVLTGLAVTATPLPAVAQDKPTCFVREGVEFHRQKNYGKAFEYWDAHARRGEFRRSVQYRPDAHPRRRLTA